jgi:hypothetical protein
MKGTNNKGRVLILLFISLLFLGSIANAVSVIDEEKLKQEAETKKAEAVIGLLDAINKRVESFDPQTQKDSIALYLFIVDKLHKKSIRNLTVDYSKADENILMKSMLEKDKQLQITLVQKAEAAGYNLREKIVMDNIPEKSGDKTVLTKRTFDFRYFYEKDGYVIKQSFNLKELTKSVTGSPALKWGVGGVGSVLLLALIIFLIYKIRKARLKTRLKRLPGRLWAKIKTHAKHKIWRKIRGAYRKYDEFADRIKSLYEEKFKLIKENLDNIEKIDVPDEELATLYTREKKRFEHRWAKKILARIEHINKDLLREISELIVFAERELPTAEKEIVEHIESEARRIKEFEAQLLETKETPGLGPAGKYYTYKDISGKNYIESGEIIKSEWGTPEINPIGRFKTTGRSIVGKNEEIHQEIREIVELTDIEKEKIEKVMSPFMRNFLKFMQELSSTVSAEEKCIEIEMRVLEALHTGKVHPGELREFRDVIKSNSEKKMEYYNKGANLIKEHFGEERNRRDLEDWLDRIEHAREEKISHVGEQLSMRVEKGETFHFAKKPLPIKGKGLPQIMDIYDLKIALERGIFDKVLEKREVIKEEIVSRKRRIKTEEGVEEIPEEVKETAEQLQEDPINIIADWIDKDYGNKELAEDVRRVTESMDWKQKRDVIINAIEQRYKTWFGHGY